MDGKEIEVTPEQAEELGEDVQWLEKRLDATDKVLSSLTTQLQEIRDGQLSMLSNQQQPTITITAEQMETLKELLEKSSGKTAEKLETILSTLQANHNSSTPQHSNNPENGHENPVVRTSPSKPKRAFRAL